MKRNALLLRLSRFALLMAVAFVLTACAGGRPAPKPQSSAPGYYKVGKPYQIKGNWYTPQEDYSYDETGIASWYGADFHQGMTANGETYNKNELTAAHKTLPMPSLARVTNLENGRAIVVRINDRGPFSGARIIDVSQRSAQLLGFEKQGTAKVRVQVLADESRAIAEAMRTYGTEPPQSQPLPQQQFASASSQPVETAPLQQPKISMADVRPVPEYTQVQVTSRTDIYVQAGAFTQTANAQRLKGKLSSLGPTAISEAVVKGVMYYRVRVGPIATVPEADKLLAKVLRSGADNARIIVD